MIEFECAVQWLTLEFRRARLRFSAVASPLINTLSAYTGYSITLIAGRLAEEGKVDLKSIHTGKTKAASPEMEKDFTQWDQAGFKLVLDQFVRFLVNASQYSFLTRYSRVN